MLIEENADGFTTLHMFIYYIPYYYKTFEELKPVLKPLMENSDIL